MTDQKETKMHWHLGRTDKELRIIDFEFVFWRVYHSWIRWQEDCHNIIAHDDLIASELALLHVIRMKDRPKTIYELGRLLNRDDTPNIQYSVKKLIELGYVAKIEVVGPKKAVAYQTTSKGVELTEAFAQVKEDIILKLIKEHELKDDQFAEATRFLTIMKGIYEEASRITAYYKIN